MSTDIKSSPLTKNSTRPRVAPASVTLLLPLLVLRMYRGTGLSAKVWEQGDSSITASNLDLTISWFAY